MNEIEYALLGELAEGGSVAEDGTTVFNGYIDGKAKFAETKIGSSGLARLIGLGFVERLAGTTWFTITEDGRRAFANERFNRARRLLVKAGLYTVLRHRSIQLEAEGSKVALTLAEIDMLILVLQEAKRRI